jgi:hypothetical protein
VSLDVRKIKCWMKLWMWRYRRKNVSRTRSFLSAVGLSCAFLLPACAQQQQAEVSKPSYVTSSIVTERATVLAVNRPERMVVLRGEDGDTHGLILDERVKNFDQIEVGDVVTAQYQAETAIFVRPSTGAPTEDAARTLQTARPGEKPGAVATHINEITATVEGIDYSNRTITLKGPRGRTRTIKVSPEVENFNAVRKGDEVVVRHTNAVAVAVTE